MGDWKNTSGDKTEHGFIREKIVEQSGGRWYKKIGIGIILAIIFGTAAGVAFAFTADQFRPKKPSGGGTEAIASGLTETDEEWNQIETDSAGEIIAPSGTDASSETAAISLSSEERKQQLYKQASQSFLTISVTKAQGVDWFDTQMEHVGELFAVIIKISDSEILALTNAAALDGSESMSAEISGKTVSVQIKQTNSRDGIVLLSIDSSTLGGASSSLVPIAMGSSDKLELGEEVMAIGSPMGYSLSLSYGRITYFHPSIQATDGEYEIYYTDMNSISGEGGILLNMDGEMVGWISDRYKRSNLTGQTSAIGVNGLKNSINSMAQGVQTALLGVFTQDVTSQISAQTGVPIGCYVNGIEDGSPAYEAGFQNGDVIVRIGESNITTCQGLQKKISASRAGETETVTVKRKGRDEYREISVEVTFVAR